MLSPIIIICCKFVTFVSHTNTKDHTHCNEMTALCCGIMLNKQTVGHKNEFDMCVCVALVLDLCVNAKK